MNRRELMVTGAAGIAFVAATEAVAATSAVTLKIDKALLNAATHCAQVAEVCQAHCLQSLATGDTMLKDCSRSVAQLLPICEALASLTAQASGYLPQYAKLALQVCKDCEQECRKHEKHHDFCKECADACAACAKECQRVAG